jgi:L-seryl-tRNA(Ser) seleniumtransferase
MPDPARRPPSIETLLASGDGRRLVESFGRARTLAALRSAADLLRRGEVTGAEALFAAARASLDRPPAGPRPVLNATGVLLHTNLGRAPLAARAREAVAAAAGACALEYDLREGTRGKRGDHLRTLLLDVFAPGRPDLDALAVTNNAAALLLALDTVANGKPVAVSRGELVAIGGDFRVPSILAKSGAALLEVGTTNKTRPRDYEEALESGAAAVLKVHPSNYRVVGFTEEVGLEALAAVASRFSAPLVYDAGSGLPGAEAALPDDPTPLAALAAGADLVCLSGDKTLGGPQAGILVGRRELVRQAAENPLARALRLDKLALAALAATLELHRDGRSGEVPFVRMLRAPIEELARRAEALAASARSAGLDASVVETVAAAGGGSGVDAELPSRAVRVAHPALSPDALAAALRALPLPVVARIADGALLLDLRSVEPEDDESLAEALRSVPRAPAP